MLSSNFLKSGKDRDLTHASTNLHVGICNLTFTKPLAHKVRMMLAKHCSNSYRHLIDSPV